MAILHSAKIALIIPTKNAGAFLDNTLRALAEQTLKPDMFLVVDSSSTDNSTAKLRAFGANIIQIEGNAFNHGGTRRMASQAVEADILILMTQDALLAHQDSLKNLVAPLLNNHQIGCVFGRQIPHTDAGILGAHARKFNYTDQSLDKTMHDAPYLGIKTCFNSDSFAAYRKSALEQIGGFPENVIGSEDTYVAGKMLLNGWTVRYEAQAIVHHSHDYTIMQEFKRYFDIGVFYGREAWIKEHFGSAGSEGIRFVISELRALFKARKYSLIALAPFRHGAKAIGYRLGKLEHYLPTPLKRQLSMFSGYWK